MQKIKTHTAIAMIWGLCAVQFASAGTAISAKELNTAGFRFYEQKQYQKAEKEFRHALQVDPLYELANYNLACVLSLQGDAASALPYLKNAIRLNSGRSSRIDQDPDLENFRISPYYQELQKYGAIDYFLVGADVSSSVQPKGADLSDEKIGEKLDRSGEWFMSHNPSDNHKPRIVFGPKGAIQVPDSTNGPLFNITGYRVMNSKVIVFFRGGEIEWLTYSNRGLIPRTESGLWVNYDPEPNFRGEGTDAQ